MKKLGYIMSSFDRFFNSKKSQHNLLSKIDTLSEELYIANTTIYHLKKEVKKLKKEKAVNNPKGKTYYEESTPYVTYPPR